MAERIARRRTAAATPERWARAAARARAEGVEVRQVNANGMWVATSGTEPVVCYLLEVVGGVVRSCSCPAGEFGDPCCKHAARFYLDAGLLDPEPPPPAAPPVPVPAACGRCFGAGWVVPGWGGWDQMPVRCGCAEGVAA